MILDEIVDHNRRELEARKQILPLGEIKRSASVQPMPLNLAAVLRGKDVKLIAEVKKASPSRGVIRADFDPVKIAGIYAENGAAVISVLTETRHFQGSLNYLREIKNLLGEKRIPLLRKDFIFDPYQVYESKAYGADALLLIAAILTPQKLKSLLELSRELWMSCLVEVHNESELEVALKSGAMVIGINNRDLTTFEVDMATTKRLRPLIPPGRIVVSESGIKDRSDMKKLKSWAVHAALVGESLMAAPDITAKMRGLLEG